MARPSATHGAFSWYELTTSDTKEARKFYGKLLDWQFQDTDMGNATYTVINVGGQGVGGITAVPPNAQGMPPAWGGYVTVDDVDAVVARAAGLGGRVLLAPTDIPTVGRFATIMDPQGATLSLITYARKN
ncbi:MAG TPA: VOC family protein [Casimicrobiaceae bacterium]|jgi:predicted enzyme related to lactoylglutathione lyase|nr:VOC family protein [Casimicrobiaceae bacterium]